MSDVDNAVSEIFGAPLEQFISRRDEAAKQLTNAGNREGAAALKKVRKPALSLWAVNQVAQRNRDEVETLLQAGAELRDVQQRAMHGEKAGASELRDASDRMGAVLDALARRAAGLLTMTGHPAGEPVLARLRQTLQSASTADDATRAALQQGRLLHELGPAGFDVFATDWTPPPSTGAKKREAPSRSEIESARREAQAAQRAATEATRNAERARQRATQRRADADRLAQQALEASQEARTAESEAADAEHEAQVAQRAAEGAAKSLARLENE